MFLESLFKQKYVTMVSIPYVILKENLTLKNEQNGDQIIVLLCIKLSVFINIFRNSQVIINVISRG